MKSSEISTKIPPSLIRSKIIMKKEPIMKNQKIFLDWSPKVNLIDWLKKQI